ncbi:MAG: PDZ domain-containing protein [Candidatus Firestonebacteria bacterium]|nr:PDZ domain-containing protein [Candidatus Firestonebacteria bacterium]
MRKYCINLFIICLLLILNSCASHNTYRTKEQKISPEIKIAVEKAIEKIKPALVRIFVVTTSYANGREIKHESAGSGAIISPDGYVITNHHVVGKATYIVCTLFDKEEIEAELIAADPLADIAIIKLIPREKKIFHTASFGNSSLIKVGDSVLAMGSPLALSQSVTMGIVSNTELVMPQFFWPFNKFELEGENIGSIVRWIGHDAPIYGGNSGGPLVNLDGEIIGINEMGMGLSGAIPGNLAKKVAEELIQNKEVTRSWIGLEIQPLLKSSGYKEGVLVSGVIEDSPAQKAGFLPGDILLKIADKNVLVNFVEQLPIFNQQLMELSIDKNVDAIVLRNNKELKIEVIPTKREKVRPPISEVKSWGMTASNLSLVVAQEMRRKTNKGVIITSIRPGGPCDEAKPAIRVNDVIVEINGIQINSINDLLAISEKILLKKTFQIPALVSFERNQEKYITVVKIGDKILEDRGSEAKKAWLGVGIQVLTHDIANILGIPNSTGVRITSVYPGSPAGKAGLLVGDFIIELDGETISSSEPQDIEVLPVLIRQYKIGSVVEFTILRNEAADKNTVTGIPTLTKMKIKAELGSTPALAKEMKKYRDKNFEFTVRDITLMDKIDTNSITNENIGVFVEAVEEGGWAALGYMAVGDIILSINGEPISDSNSTKKIMQEIKLKNLERIVFQVQRGIHKLFIELKVDKRRKDEI